MQAQAFFVQEEHSPRYAQYDTLADEALVKLSQRGDNEALEQLFAKYRNFVRSRARCYFIMGADQEDLVQEGMIGFFKAVRDYNHDHTASFRVFADLCITRQMITAIKSATRQKHMPLNSYISLNRPLYDEDSERTLMDVITESEGNNPEEMFITREDQSYLERRMNEVLSALELEVLNSYLQDKSYQEIARELNRHVKSVDNALQRIKRKMEKVMESK